MTPDHKEAVSLKPCPFCGCAATFVKHSVGVPDTRGFDKWDAVACKHCRATIGAHDRRFRSREDARDAWNRRTLSAQAGGVERQPLSDEQIEQIRRRVLNDLLDRVRGVIGGPDVVNIEFPALFARAIEAAHDITDQNPIKNGESRTPDRSLD